MSDERSSSSDDEVYNPAEIASVAAALPPPVVVAHEEAAVKGACDVMKQRAAPQPPIACAGRSLPSSPIESAPVHDDLPLDSGGLRLHSIKGRVRCVCVNRPGSLLCAGGEDGQLVMWDFEKDLPTRRVQATRVLTPFVNRVSGLQPIVAMHFSLDDAYVVACQDGDSPVVVGAGGKTFGYCAMGERGLANVVQCKGHRAPVTASCAHTGKASQFLTCSQDGTARLWDQASFERASLYAVKHGSGQITDTVAVESVLSLSRFSGAGAVFSTAGEDGRVQLWDSRVKYRPGGALATWDVYALPIARSTSAADDEEVFERHTGGLAELAGPVLAVRRGGVVQFLDLRGGGGLQNKSVRCTASCLAYDALVGLPFSTDTTPLVASADGESLLTCTARAGLHHVVGGHVVSYDVSQEGNGARAKLTWRAGKADEDVLCAAMDADRRLFAGLSSGDVVVQRGCGSSSSTGTDSSPVDRWLGSRPRREVDGTGRVAGEKSARDDSGVAAEDLF